MFIIENFRILTQCNKGCSGHKSPECQHPRLFYFYIYYLTILIRNTERRPPKLRLGEISLK